MRAVQIGSHSVGPGHPCFLVAEIGINHNGDVDLAKRSIDAAAQAGADAVKFQNFRTEDFVSDRSLTYDYVSQGKAVTESQFDLFKRVELPEEALKELKAQCERHNVVFHSTPTSVEGIQALVDLGTPMLKNGSDYLTHLPLIAAMGRTQLPTVISVGMSTVAEIDEAVRAFRDTGNEELVLLHCVSSYPAPFEDVNLRRMAAIAQLFDCPVGFSDHTEGTAAAIGAVALGACLVEKHFTLDKTMAGPDHRFSADPVEFKALVDGVRAVEASMGSADVRPTRSEAQNRRDSRLSIVAARDLPQGHLLVDEDLAFRRPGTGMPPKFSDLVLGRRTARELKGGDVLSMADIA